MNDDDHQLTTLSRSEIIGRLLMLSGDVRVRADPRLADAARVIECLALLLFQEQEGTLLDVLLKSLAQVCLHGEVVE